MRLGKPLAGEWPVSQHFGERSEYYARWGWAGHPGIDYACPVGIPVLACHDGGCEPKYDPNGWGDYVKVHGNEAEWTTLYAHMSQVNMAMGQQVREGDVLGLSGNSGNSTGPHLHLGTQWTKLPNPCFKNWIDPGPWLEKRETMTKTSAHIQRIESWMEQALVDLGVSWVKLVNAPPGPDPMPRIPNKIVRIWTDDIDDDFVCRGEAGGRNFVRHMLPQWQERPWATCYSLANEPGCNSYIELTHLNAYSIGAMQEASANGIKVVIFETPESNPSGGDPYSYQVKRDKLARLVPAVQLATALGHYIGVHAYWRPGVEGPLGGFHALGEVVLKHDVWHLMGAYSSEPKFLVTEWGLDGAIESNPHEGWRAFVARGEITERDYIEGLVAGEALAQQKPWLKALFKFTYGYEGQWASYDHDAGFVRNLVAAMPNLPVNEEPVEPPALPPAVPDEPTLDDVRWGREALGTWPATMKDARLHQEEWIMQDPLHEERYISRNPTNDVYYVVVLDPQTWQRIRATPLGQTSDLL